MTVHCKYPNKIPNFENYSGVLFTIIRKNQTTIPKSNTEGGEEGIEDELDSSFEHTPV